MSTTTAADYTTVGPDAADYDRYAVVTLAEGRVLLYDRDREDAWIDTDTAVPVTEVR